MAIITIGIDLAKNVFAVHCVDETGKPVLVGPSIKRAAGTSAVWQRSSFLLL